MPDPPFCPSGAITIPLLSPRTGPPQPRKWSLELSPTKQTMTSTSNALVDLAPDAVTVPDDEIIQDLLDEIDRLRLKLRTDDLTKLANRDGLYEHAAATKCTVSVASVLLIDLDQFKSVNDAFGHLAGDVVLRDTANQLRAVSHGDELAVRLSGDEFAFWLAPQSSVDTATAHARDRADEVTRVLDRTVDLGLGDNRCVAASATVGVGVLDSPPGVDAVLALADTDMYRHKPARIR